MGRRSLWRIPIRMNVSLNCSDNAYSGTVMNLSENGMFINTDETRFPSDSKFKVMIPEKEEVIQVPARLVWSKKADSLNSGIGVELLNPPQEYIEFVENLMLVL